MSCVGSPTAVRIRSMVTNPALGMLAAPTLANVAVRLWGERERENGGTQGLSTSMLAMPDPGPAGAHPEVLDLT